MSNPSYLRLSQRDRLVVSDVHLFRQLSSQQIRRLYFSDGSEASQGVRCSRTMRRLVKWGIVSRIDRAIGGSNGGSSGYFFTPPTSRARQPNPHAYDIAELYVRLKEQLTGVSELLAFDPEPYSHFQVGNLEIKPDAYVRIRTADGVYRYNIEVDLASEWRTQLGQKMRRYVNAFKNWPLDPATGKLPPFPLVLFIVPDEARLRLVESVVKRQEYPNLFEVVLMDEAVQRIVQ